MINFKYFALLTILSLIIQCKHDSDVGPEKNSNRTKYITSLHNGIENWKSELIYTNDKLTQVISMHNDNGEWENEEITNIEYQNNLIISTNRNYINGEWTNSHKYEFLMKDNQIMEYRIFSSDNINYQYKYTYLYEDSKTERISVRINGNIESEEGKTEILFDNQKVSKIKSYEKDDLNQWKLFRETNTDHSHEDIVEYNTFVINENDEWELTSRTQMVYDNDKVVEINTYEEYSNDGFWYLSDKRIYLYDTNGFLYKIIGKDGDETNYTYEEGHGNAELFYNIPLLKTIGYPSIKGSMLEKHKSDCSFLF